MIINRYLFCAFISALIMLTSCGGQGVELGEFPALNKTEGDAPFALIAPTSRSPAAFTYTSSNPTVATIDGNIVTIRASGSSTITAQQGSLGSYYPTSTSALLTVAPLICPSGAVAIHGVCIKATVFPPYLLWNGVTWMPTSFQLNWADADKFCSSVKINDLSGWKLPSQSELLELAAETRLEVQHVGQFWALADTWTATGGKAEKTHFSVNLASAATVESADDYKAYVTCVHSGQ